MNQWEKSLLIFNFPFFEFGLSTFALSLQWKVFSGEEEAEEEEVEEEAEAKNLFTLQNRVAGLFR